VGIVCAVVNRPKVKEEKGVKIYFDPVETAARVRINQALVRGLGFGVGEKLKSRVGSEGGPRGIPLHLSKPPRPPFS
jgi:hypothetical protein